MLVDRNECHNTLIGLLGARDSFLIVSVARLDQDLLEFERANTDPPDLFISFIKRSSLSI